MKPMRWINALAPGRRFVRVLLLVVVPLIVVLTGMYLYVRGGREVETENAYVKADVLAVSAEVSGRVAEVLVRDNQPVAAGALLFRLDPTPFEIAVAKARAQMDVVRTDVQSLRAEYRATLLEAAEPEERIEFLTRQLERQEMLKEQGMSRADVYDEARHNLQAARSRLQEHSREAPTACSRACSAIRSCRRSGIRASRGEGRVRRGRGRSCANAGEGAHRWRGQQHEAAGRRARGEGRADLQPDPERAGVGGSQLQGDAAHAHASRPARAGRGRRVSGHRVAGARSPPSRPRPARSSRSCRRRTRPATGSRWCSACRCAPGRAAARAAAVCAPA